MGKTRTFFINLRKEIQISREADHYYIERIVKTILWMKGGFKVYVSAGVEADAAALQVAADGFGGVLGFGDLVHQHHLEGVLNGINVELKHTPVLDPEFIPLMRFNQAFLEGAKKPTASTRGMCSAADLRAATMPS